MHACRCGLVCLLLLNYAVRTRHYRGVDLLLLLLHSESRQVARASEGDPLLLQQTVNPWYCRCTAVRGGTTLLLLLLR